MHFPMEIEGRQNELFTVDMAPVIYLNFLCRLFQLRLASRITHQDRS
jgi:hypothetical protein